MLPMSEKGITQNNITTNSGKVVGHEETNIYGLKPLTKFDQSSKENHFNVFPRSNYHVNDLYIFPNIKCNDIQELESKEVEINNDKELINFICDKKITFILGGYGVGKSMLIKKINYELKEKHKILYISSTQLEDYVALNNLEYDLDDESTIIIIDSIDELNNTKSVENEQSKKLIEFLAERLKPNHKLIISTRIVQNDIDKSIENYLNIICDSGIFSFGLIALQSFSKHHIKNWIEKYSWYKEDKDAKYLFEYSDIKRWKKGLQSALSNPLMLFLFSENFISKNNEPDFDIYDIYDLYSDFVSKTVKGKFDFETKRGSKQLPPQIQEEYRAILKSIAFSILRYNYNNYIPNTENEFLDTNRELFYISEQDIDNTLKVTIENFILNSKITKGQENPLKSNLLNCYFFEYHPKYWRFNDNNILFFFVAEKYFEIFKEYIFTDLKFFYKKLLEYSDIPINAIIIELLLQKLKKEKKCSEILLQLEQMIKNGYFINFETAEHLDSISIYKVNCDILLSIVYLNLTGSKKTYLDYFIKRMTWYTSSVKLIDNRITYLVKRFFKECNLFDTEIRRINLKEFNFDSSKLKNVTFLQNKIHKSRFNNVVSSPSLGTIKSRVFC